eukprot:ctg_2334.g352
MAARQRQVARTHNRAAQGRARAPPLPSVVVGGC